MISPHEPYVADPAEPAPPRRFARLQPVLWTLVIVLLIGATTAMLLRTTGEENPGLTGPNPTEAP